MARKESNIHYIYKTTCKVTNRYYIGMHSTSNLEDGYMGSGKRLRYSIRKHGKENHVREILEFFETRELLIEAEKKAITLDMITDNNCMNLTEGGTGGHGARFLSKKQLTKGGKNYQKKYNGCSDYLTWAAKGGKTTFERHGMPDNLIQDWAGRKHSEESKKLMSETSKGMGVGKDNSQHGTCWITKRNINKKIKKKELKKWVGDGWIKGRVVKTKNK